jgi:hypothetical protein
LVHASLEEGFAACDGVGVGVLEERVGIEAEPVDGINDGRVGRVGPSSPSIDVTNWDAIQRSARNGGSDGGDIVDNSAGVLSDTSIGFDSSDRVTVKILTSDGDTDNQVAEVVAVGLDSGLQSGNFVVKGVARGPQAKKQSNILGDSSGDGGNGSVGGATLL